jgi:hypothetical protein
MSNTKENVMVKSGENASGVNAEHIVLSGSVAEGASVSEKSIERLHLKVSASEGEFGIGTLASTVKGNNPLRLALQIAIT